MSLSGIGVARVDFEHNGTSGGVLLVNNDGGSNFQAYWNPNGNGTDTVIGDSGTFTLTQGAGSGWAEFCPWSTINLRFEDTHITKQPDLSKVSSLTTVRETFKGCSSMTGTPDLSLWPASVTNIFETFMNCTSMTGTVDLSPASAVTNARSAFQGCTGLVGEADLRPMTAVQDTQTMFFGCTGISSANLTGLTAMTSCGGLFRDCSSLTTVTGFETATALVSAADVFRDCVNLVGAFDLSGLTNAITTARMFEGCSSLTQLPDLSPLTSVTNAASMFNECTSMTGTPDLTGLGLVQSAEFMFARTLVSGNVDFSAMTNLSSARFMFQSCRITGITGETSLSSLTDARSMFVNCDLVVQPIDLSGMASLEQASEMFSGTGINGLTAGTNPNVYDWQDAFTETSLSAADIDAWVISIDTHNVATPGDFSYSNLPSNAALDANRSPAAAAAVTSLLGKGWTRAAGSY